MIKDYLILEKLGVGSYGTVYKVKKKSSNKIFVIKQVSLLGVLEGQKKEYESEAKILNSIKSNYVVKYYDSFEDGNNLNIVMEYCDGGDLYQFIKEKNKKKDLMKEDLIWELFIKMILGLSSIHKKKILHRDLKSQNIFLTKKLEVKIGDLGVAKILNKTNFAKTFIGTPFYLSPELCLEKPYNDKSDIWALGCILYELCTYKHPFNAKSQGALILKILNKTPEKINKYYSRDLQKMLDLLLNKNYLQRPNCSDILKMPSFLIKAKKYDLLDEVLNENANLKYQFYSELDVFSCYENKENKKRKTNDKSKKYPVNQNLQVNRSKIQGQNLFIEKSNDSHSFFKYISKFNNNFYYNSNKKKVKTNNNIEINLFEKKKYKIFQNVIKTLNQKSIKFFKKNGKEKSKTPSIKNIKKSEISFINYKENTKKKESNEIIDYSYKQINILKNQNYSKKIFNPEEKINILKKDNNNQENLNEILNNENYKLNPKNKFLDIKEFANDLNEYVDRYKHSEFNTLNKEYNNKINLTNEPKNPYKNLSVNKSTCFCYKRNNNIEQNNLTKNENNNKKNNSTNNLEINIEYDKNKVKSKNFINNNINININNINNNSIGSINNANNILNSIMNFKIINNNDSDIHININNNNNSIISNKENKIVKESNITNSNIKMDEKNNLNNTDSVSENQKELYNEEEDSEEQDETVQEIKMNKISLDNKENIDGTKNENDIKNKYNKEKKYLEEKINIIKDEMLALVGGIDYNYIINLYNNTDNENENVDEIYEKIEKFVKSHYDEKKKESFDNLYYLLISLDCQLVEKNNKLRALNQ